MIKTIISTAAILFATGAMADGYNIRQGTVVDVEAVYSNSYTHVVQEQCFEQQVPVYQNRQGSTGDVFAGAIIGGAIGNQFGGGSGKDAMTILGAIVGADVASRPRDKVVGYTSEWRCEMVEVPQETRVFHHYQVTYLMNGKHYRINTDRLFEVGQRITINE
jgi:uncharacterized protein YcfJ